MLSDLRVMILVLSILSTTTHPLREPIRIILVIRASTMAGHQRQRANSSNNTTNQERDEILEGMAEQLRQIQERLERLEATGC